MSEIDIMGKQLAHIVNGVKVVDIVVGLIGQVAILDSGRWVDINRCVIVG